MAITFDHDITALTVGLPILKARQLPATFYVSVTTGTPATGFVDLIDNPNYAGLTPRSIQLADAQKAGWEIGIYSNTSMPAILGAGDPADALIAKQFMMALKNKLGAKGFIAKSFAPNGRAWNEALANLSRDVFDNVRVASDPPMQAYPIADPSYVRFGATNSLGGGDTAEGLCAQLKAVTASGSVLWPIVVHGIGPNPGPYIVATTEFTGFANCLETARNAGAVRVTTFTRAMKAPD